MNILLFVVVVAVSFIVIRIGAIALQLTGLEWSLAKFQALSCFSSTGFTTREAELITSDPRRRKIASVLMILGNAGLVTLIATFANSLRPWNVIDRLEIPFISQFVLKSASPWINLAIIVIAVYALYRIFTSTIFTHKITDHIRRRLLDKHFTEKPRHEALLVAPRGYIVSKIQIAKDSPLANKNIQTLEMHNITALTVIRGEAVIANPSPFERILADDELICFGLSSVINEIMFPNQPNPKISAFEGKNEKKAFFSRSCFPFSVNIPLVILLRDAKTSLSAKYSSHLLVFKANKAFFDVAPLLQPVFAFNCNPFLLRSPIAHRAQALKGVQKCPGPFRPAQ